MKILTTLAITATLLVSGQAFAKSCADFKTQKAAQNYHDKLKASGKDGWKSLDRDGDGRACTDLPEKASKSAKKKDSAAKMKKDKQEKKTDAKKVATTLAEKPVKN